jgi:hypothetical protein
MSIEALSHALEQRGLPPAEKLVLIHLADDGDVESHRTRFHVSRLVGLCNLSGPDELNAILASLSSRGLVKGDLAGNYEYAFRMVA